MGLVSSIMMWGSCWCGRLAAPAGLGVTGSGLTKLRGVTGAYFGGSYALDAGSMFCCNKLITGSGVVLSG